MARILIVGCGCRGRELARELVGAGHAVRGTTRDPAELDAISEAGAEAVIADPDRVGTIVEQLAGVTVLVHLLGRVADEDVHGHRLRALFEKVVDSPVRGVLYEPAAGGCSIAHEAAATWAIPVAFLEDGADAAELVLALIDGST